MRWENFVFERGMGACVEQIKVLSHLNFLVIVTSFEEQQRILSALPLYMDAHILVAILWAMDFKLKPIGSNNTLVWIDLMLVDPMLKISSNFMLNQAGRLVYVATSANLRNFAHI